MTTTRQPSDTTSTGDAGRDLVETTSGPVRGRLEDGIAVFRAIPYAAAPFGEHRFQAPAPHVPWTEELDCSRFGATAPKPPYPDVVAGLLPEPVIAGEECLNLNVWTPDPDAVGLPVFVWVHGGAFQNGSSAVPVYDGAAFARDGVVAVTINYRLGVDGFLRIPDRPDNRGLLDQVAALEWVRDNVAAFGGDPENVTIAGESAGAMSVTTLCAMPAARGLFHRVIAQSGGGHHALTPGTADLVTARIAEKLGVDPTADGIGSVPLPDLLVAHEELNAEIATATDPTRWRELGANAMTFEPVVDGDSLPGLPIEVIARGDGADVDLLVGSNADEHALFLHPLLTVLDEPTVRMLVAARGAADTAYDTYARDGATPGGVLVAALTDWFFRIPAVRLAEARAAHGQDTYVYRFGWRTPVLDGVLGSCHGLEIGFAFDALQVPEGRMLAGDAPPQELADAMHASWVAFVRDGDPGWPAYGDARNVRQLGGEDDGQVLTDPDADERMLWPDR